MKIVITGTSRGIGLELTRQGLSNGHHILAVARKPEVAYDLQRLRTEFPDRLEVLALDVTQRDAPEHLQKALGHWASLDLLINNAGIYEQDEDVDAFIRSFRTNTIAPFLLSEALLPKLSCAVAPKVVSISSTMGSITSTSGGSYAYRASKAALNMIHKCFSLDHPDIISMVIHPGWVQTSMGGDDAQIPVEESAQGIWKVIDSLRPQDSGAFVDYQGRSLPW